jgi:hypothetical protein
MFRRLSVALLLLAPAPALAESDELEAVPTQAVVGHPYAGDLAPSRIRFVNVRDRPVRLLWISFEGMARPYAVVGQGEEIVQPTYVAHRWLVEDAGDRQPLEAFISTRSAARDNGASQIAIIR